jgi:hypothetical protein
MGESPSGHIMRTVLVLSVFAALSGCATLPMTPWEEARLKGRLRQEGFTQAIQVIDEGPSVRVRASGPDGLKTERLYSRSGLQLREETTDRGDNSFMRQSLNSGGEVLHIEFWVGKD